MEKEGEKKITFGTKKEKRGRFQKKKQGGRKKGARKTRDFSWKTPFCSQKVAKTKKGRKEDAKKGLKTKREGAAKKQQAIKPGIERPISL